MSSAWIRALSVVTLSFTVGACAFDTDGDHHDDGEEPTGQVSSELSATDTVEAAVSQACSTTAVKALSQQLVDEIQCMRPGTLSRIDNISGLSLGSAVFPYLQTPAAKALASAQQARGRTLAINSALRALPQQYLLYRWYRAGRCGIGLAASPGRSNHESAVALDIQDNAGWRSSMTSKGFRWLGSSDPVHFDFVGSGAVDLRGLSVKAFQRLWNRNHPEDRIDEDGAYGPQTEKRLARSPIGGFAKGACSASPTTVADPAPADAPFVAPTEADGPEPEPEAASTTDEPAPLAPAPGAADAQGCAASPTRATGGGAWAALLTAAAIATATRRRRRAAAR
ncbi:MAG: M15 family metallopeptidase [Myxococcales bacterium]|nr:M15 family metallopeptidase [Myxococcales bacterium]